MQGNLRWQWVNKMNPETMVRNHQSTTNNHTQPGRVERKTHQERKVSSSTQSPKCL